MDHDFKKGDRVKLSDEGARALYLHDKNNRLRRGTVTNVRPSPYVNVHWDGQSIKSAGRYSPLYIELA